MNDIIAKYIENSKNSIINISNVLEDNIEFLDNNLWSSKEEFNEIITKVVNIYYDKYYLYKENNFENINKYIKFSNSINRKLKTILLAIIDYYESTDNIKIITQKESSILYLTILMYVSLVLYNTKFNLIEEPKGIEKTINNIIDNFAKIRFNKNKDLNNIIETIKDDVVKNNEFRNTLDSLMNKESHNAYINLSNENKYYKVLYEYDIDALDEYDGKDIRIVINELDIFKKFMFMSFDLAYYTSFKLLEKGLDYKLLLPINKDDIDNETLDKLLENKNDLIVSNILLTVDFEDIENNYEFVNNIKKRSVGIAINVNKNFESENYNMFMNVLDIVVEEEFLSINNRYLEIWKDMNINFIIKNMDKKVTEKELLNNK